MKRRDFLFTATLAGAASALTPLAGRAASKTNRRGEQPAGQAEGLVVNGLDASNISREYIDMNRAAKVDCMHLSMGGVRSFADAHNLVDANSAAVRVIRSVREIRQARQEGRLALLLGWQSASEISGPREGPNDWWSAESHTELRGYYEMGLRICGIAYQIANAFGGGGIDAHVPLSRAGRRLVEEIHKLRIVLDVGGHTGDRTSLDALAISSGVPVICSHGATRHFANSTRNLSDEVLDGIAHTGGVIGLPAISDFVLRGKEMANVEPSPLGTVDDMLKHADYVKSRVGAQHVGLGPDFTHGKSLKRDYDLFGADVMDKGPRRYVKGFESITELPNIVAGLQKLGWTPAEIRGFMGENWIRVYEKVWGV